MRKYLSAIILFSSGVLMTGAVQAGSLAENNDGFLSGHQAVSVRPEGAGYEGYRHLCVQ